MKFTIEKQISEATISFSLPATEWDKYIERSYAKNKSTINIAGFRKGHAPRHLIEKMYGKGIFFDDAFDFCFKDSYSAALEQNPDLYPVEEPRIKVDTVDEKGIKFTATFALKPEPTVGQYKELEIEKVEYTVGGKDIDEELERVRARLVRKVEKEGEVASGDIINLDYSGSVDGIKFEGGTAEKQELEIGSGSFIPGFEEQTIGMKIGEEKDITVKFPEEYHSQALAGKEAVFNIKINGIMTKELPELNDAFAAEVSSHETLQEYREEIEKNIREKNENRAKQENENKLVEKIIENSSVEIPEAMLESELSYMLEDFSYRLMYMYNGMKLADYFKYTNSSEAEYKASKRDEAYKNVKTRLVLQKIVEIENLNLTQEEIDAEVEKRAEEAKKTADEYKKTMDSNEMNYIYNQLLSKKIIDFLTENNSFVEKAKQTA
jgi:trigger factor